MNFKKKIFGGGIFFDFFLIFFLIFLNDFFLIFLLNFYFLGGEFKKIFFWGGIFFEIFFFTLLLFFTFKFFIPVSKSINGLAIGSKRQRFTCYITRSPIACKLRVAHASIAVITLNENNLRHRLIYS